MLCPEVAINTSVGHLAWDGGASRYLLVAMEALGVLRVNGGNVEVVPNGRHLLPSESSRFLGTSRSLGEIKIFHIIHAGIILMSTVSDVTLSHDVVIIFAVDTVQY